MRWYRDRFLVGVTLFLAMSVVLLWQPVPPMLLALPSGDYFLHLASTDVLTNAPPTPSTALFKDSPSLTRTVFKEIGTWSAAPADTAVTVTAVQDLHVWLGLKNSDDQGTLFDLRAELWKTTTTMTGSMIAAGVTPNIQGVTRNPSQAKEVKVVFGPISNAQCAPGERLSLKILVKVANSGGHSNAVGARLYYGALSRPSRFGVTLQASVSPPTVVLQSPVDGTLTRSPAQTITGTVSDPGVTSATLHHNGVTQAIPVSIGTFSTALTLIEGINTLKVLASNTAGTGTSAEVRVTLDTTPPVVAITAPPPQSLVRTPTLSVTGTVDDATATVQVNGVAATVTPGSPAQFTATAALQEGANLLTATATDAAGNVGTAQITVTRQTLPVVTITAPVNLSYANISPTTVTGTVDDLTATVTVNAVPAAVVSGNFSVAIPLAEGPNIVTATARTPASAVGVHSIQVTLDTTPPRVTITSPPDQFVTTDSTIAVAGIVNDIVVGTVNDQQAQVTVNGAPAQVANRTFLATEVPLALGSNVIQAVGRDRVGNAATTQVTVTRQAPGQQAQIKLISGNNQAGVIGSLLSSPLVVALTDAAGSPAPNHPVIFKVTQNDGMVAVGGPPIPSVIATTDAQGQAQVQWTLGARAGAGANAVEAYAVGFDGTAFFVATGTPSPAGKIVVDSGNDQISAVNQPLPRPLIAVVVDSGNNRLANVPVTFTVIEGGGSVAGQSNFAGVPVAFTVSQSGASITAQPSVTVSTDSDGRAAATWTLGPQEGNANHRVQANFSANQGHPADFTASGRAPGNPAQTTIAGVVLDNSNVPIPGVTIRAVLTNILNSNVSALQAVAAVQTNAQGQFAIPQAPVGFVKLLVDGTTAQLPGQYPSLEYDLVTVAGHNNTVGMPIYLLPLNPANQLCVTPTTGGGTLTMPEAPGFSLTFGPGQVTFPGGAKTGCISVTVVHGDKVPMVPGFGQQPRFIVTIQPAGAAFNPPAPITLPNVDGLKPRAVTEMYSFDHDIGSFVAIGTGTVSDDGQVIRSDPGVGVLKAGWHCGGDPSAIGTVADCKECMYCQDQQGGGRAGGSCVADPNQDGALCRGRGDGCTIFVCQDGACTAVGSRENGTTCKDDGDPCTADICEQGVCKHQQVPEGTSCEGDGNECTSGLCQAGHCVETPTPGASCDDGNPCTFSDICNGDLCMGIPNNGAACETDGNQCTTGVCNGTTCVETPTLGAPCNDGNDCTIDDICNGDKCQGRPNNGAVCSDDDNKCTEDICQNAECKHLLIDSCDESCDPKEIDRLKSRVSQFLEAANALNELAKQRFVEATRLTIIAAPKMKDSIKDLKQLIETSGEIIKDGRNCVVTKSIGCIDTAKDLFELNDNLKDAVDSGIEAYEAGIMAVDAWKAAILAVVQSRARKSEAKGIQEAIVSCTESESALQLLNNIISRISEDDSTIAKIDEEIAELEKLLSELQEQIDKANALLQELKNLISQVRCSVPIAVLCGDIETGHVCNNFNIQCLGVYCDLRTCQAEGTCNVQCLKSDGSIDIFCVNPKLIFPGPPECL